MVAGCPMLPPDNIWNTRVDALPVHPRSSDYIASIGASTGLHPDFGSGTWNGGPIGIPYVGVPGTQPRVPVSFFYASESDPGPYPIPPDAPIEGGPDSSGDRHVLVVDRGQCKLYELYRAFPLGGGTSWRADSGAVFDLRSHALRPETWTSADAAGLPILPGLVRYEEVAAGEIGHAIRFYGNGSSDIDRVKTDTPFVVPVPGLGLQLVASGLASPVTLANAGDGSKRLFIVEQTGRVGIHNGAVVLPAPFLDITNRVLSGGERGLLGLAFHPSYAANGFFYVYYTSQPNGDIVIARYRVSADPDLAEPGSELVLLIIPHPSFSNHNGGALVFGPDGCLYAGVGDGGGAGDPGSNAQNLGTLLGKIIRIDAASGAPCPAPPGNPFVSTPGARSEIWALGLRNPWRITFDLQTGDLLIGDVGQGSREEVDFQLASSAGGQNYCWKRKEGTLLFDPSVPCTTGTPTDPVLEYAHTDGNCSITGGHRYRGVQSPTLVGTYFYGDLCSGRIWGGTRQGDGTWTTAELLNTALTISTFGEDEDGEVYVAHYAASAGAVYGLVVNDVLAAAVLPASRSVQVDAAATAFATIINAGPSTATACGLAGRTLVSGSFLYQTTDPATNLPTGNPNTPVDIPAGGLQTYVFAFTPSAPVAPTEVGLAFDCTSTAPAAVIAGVNTLLLSASSSPGPDVIALAATLSGDGIVNVPGATGTGLFAVGTSNVGATGTITVSADTGGVTLPLTLTVCETNTATGACLVPPTPTVTVAYVGPSNRSFAVFAQGNGIVPFSPGVNRVFVRFRDGGGQTRGATSVAVRTQ